MADINRNSHKIIYRKYTSAVKYILMALSVIIITYSLPKQAKFKYEFEKGNVWLHDDLISPYNYPIKKTQEQIKEDKENVLKALDLNGNLAEAHTTLGTILYRSEWKWEEARKELELALELNPNYLSN